MHKSQWLWTMAMDSGYGYGEGWTRPFIAVRHTMDTTAEAFHSRDGVFLS